MEIKIHHSIICRLVACLETQSFHPIHFIDYMTLKEAAGQAKDTIQEAREIRREIAKDKTLTVRNRKKMKALVGIVDAKPQPLKMAREYLSKKPHSSLKEVKQHLLKNHIKPNSVNSTISRLKKQQPKEKTPLSVAQPG